MMARPNVSPAEAKSVWNRMKRPSVRAVATRFSQAGRPIHHSTIAAWRKNNWRPIRDAYGPAVNLDRAIPLLTGEPDTTVSDLVPAIAPRETSLALGEANGRRAALEGMADDRLALESFRSTLITTTLISEELRLQGALLVATMPKEVGNLLEAIAATLNAASTSYQTWRDVAMKTVTPTPANANGKMNGANGHAHVIDNDPLAAELAAWGNVK